MSFSRRASSIVSLVALLALGCPGDGGSGKPPEIIFDSTPECIVIAGGFPSGFTGLPDPPGRAAVAQFIPTAVLGLDLETEPPQLLATQAIPGFPLLPSPSCGGSRVDSDSDGRPDPDRSKELGFACSVPVPGALRSIEPNLVALAMSKYEQIVLVDPRDGTLQFAQLDTPVLATSFDPADWPFWPAPGDRPFQSGFSTRACVYGSGFVDHLGDPIGANTRCDAARNGFFTGFTADALRVADQLFVTTSNLNQLTSSFQPGTVLRFDYDRSSDPPTVRPRAEGAILLTSGYNPTSLTPYMTPNGRNLVLVAVTGAIDLGTGADLVRTDSAVDVIDVLTGTLIASIPLGRAGSGLTGIALDSSGRLGLLGASTRRALFGIDLAPLDDPMLGLGPDPLPIRLDGSTPGFADARVFDADDPFELPKRTDGPSDSVCTTNTSVAIKQNGDFAVTTDFCDGTVSVLDLELPAARTTPIDRARVLRVNRVLNVAAPLIPSATGLPRAIERILIRPGTPGVDFQGPDVHYTLGLTEGAVCGVRIESR